MAKDPAVLFYFQDFLVGTEFMTDDEVGKYIRILCHQADKGALSESQLKRICRSEIPEAIKEKLLKDNNGNFYQNRMRIEKEKREKHCEHQRENANKRWNKSKCDGNAVALPLLNENENEDININENENEDINIIKKINSKLNIDFAIFWNLYDKKEDRIKCERKWRNLTNAERSLCITKLPDYIEATPDKQFRKDPATYLNNKSWENEIVKTKGNDLKISTKYL